MVLSHWNQHWNVAQSKSVLINVCDAAVTSTKASKSLNQRKTRWLLNIHSCKRFLEKYETGWLFCLFEWFCVCFSIVWASNFTSAPFYKEKNYIWKNLERKIRVNLTRCPGHIYIEAHFCHTRIMKVFAE